MTPNIVLTCGGTGGHVYPAIALAQALAQHIPPIEPLMVGSVGRIDASIVARYQLPFIGIAGRSLGSLGLGILKSLRILRQHRTRAVIATGGSVTLCMGIAAGLLGIPLIVLEQNSRAGRTNRLLHRWSKRTIVAMDPTQGLTGPKVRCWGNPVRAHFHHEPWLTDALLPITRAILIMGGSQGAHAINQLATPHFTAWAEQGYDIIHLMGETGYRAAGYQGTHHRQTIGSRQCIIAPYIEGMDQVYRVSDVVISRAGATTIAELLAFNKPAVLIPYPHAMDQHQDANAAWMVAQGRAICLPESRGHALPQAVTELATCRPLPAPPPAQDAIVADIMTLCDWHS